MGYGEDYWVEFDAWFKLKSPDQKRAYAAEFPEPAEWPGFYQRKGIDI